MTDPQPLTGDELAAIKARAEAATPGPWRVDKTLGWDTLVGPDGHDYVAEFGVRDDPDAAHCAGMDPETTLRLVAEVERLRADNEMGRINLAHYSEIIDLQAGQTERLQATLDLKRGIIEELSATVERLEADAP